MKVSLQQLLKIGASVAIGSQQGQIMGDQERDANSARQFGQLLDLARIQGQQQDRADGREMQRLGMYRNLLDSDLVDDEYGGQLMQQYVGGLNNLTQPHADPYAALFQHPYIQRLYRQAGMQPPAIAGPMAGGGHTPVTPRALASAGATAGPFGGAPPTSAPSGPPGAAPVPPAGAAPPTSPVPGMHFRGPRERRVEALVSQRLQRIRANADTNEDSDTAQKTLDIETRLTRRDITADQALQELDGLDHTSRVSASVLSDFKAQRGDLERYVAQGQIAPEHVQDAQNLLGQMKAIGSPSTPDKRTQASTLLAQLGELYKRPGLITPTAQQQFAQDQAKYQRFVQGKNENDQFFDALRNGKDTTPEAVLARARNMDTFNRNPEWQNYGYKLPVDFDFSKRKVKRGEGDEAEETDAEVEARNLAAAAKYTEDSKQKNSLLKAGYDKLFDLVKSGSVKDPKQQVSIIQSLNDVAEELGIPSLPKDLQIGLTPSQQAAQDERVKSREASDKRNTAYVQDLKDREKDREFNRTMKLRAQRFQEQQANKRGAKADNSAALQRIKGLADDIDELDKKIEGATGLTGIYGPLVTRNNPKMQGEADKTVGPWIAERKRLAAERDRLIGTLPGGKQAFQGRVDEGDAGGGSGSGAVQFQYGGKAYSVANNYPDRAVPTPGPGGQDREANYAGKFGKFNQEVLQIAMGLVGNPQGEAEFKKRFKDPDAANLYLWEARFKMSQRGNARQ